LSIEKALISQHNQSFGKKELLVNLVKRAGAERLSLFNLEEIS
jgi:hypothetical protein